jgi:hypothetical protein
MIKLNAFVCFTLGKGNELLSTNQTTDVKVLHTKKNPAVSGGALRGLGIRNKQTTSPAIFVFVEVVVRGCKPYQGEAAENERPRH